MDQKEYWAEIRIRAKEKAKDKNLLFHILSSLFITLVGFAIHWVIAGKGEAMNEIVAFICYFIGALILTPFISIIWYMAQEPALMDEKKSKEIIKLKSIMSIKEYEDIQLIHYKYPSTDIYKRKSVWDEIVVNTLAFQVENQGGASLLDCKIRFLDGKNRPNKTETENLESWNPIPDIEKKLLQWDDKLRGKSGTINIGAGCSEIIKLADLSSNISFVGSLFYFVFSDGKSCIPRIDGEYIVILRLEAKVKKDDLLVDITPLLFDIKFNFIEKSKFNLIEVVKHEKQES